MALASSSGKAVAAMGSQKTNPPATTDTKAAGQPTTAAAATSPDDYLIGPEDILAINVWRDPEISRTVPVRPDGKISLPLIGDLDVNGLTTLKVRSLIVAKLKEYIANPEVSVIVQEIKSRTYVVMGKVTKPGSYPLAKPTSVLEAIAVAGGFLEFAKQDKIYVLRRMEDGSQKALPFNYKQVIKGRKLDQNVELKTGDTVVVP
jgi:polysaccharide export outer membrane protein